MDQMRGREVKVDVRRKWGRGGEKGVEGVEAGIGRFARS